MGTEEDATAIPYRTGTYLIFDNEAGRPESDNHFRSGRDLVPPLRASGSHQLDATVFAAVVGRIAAEAPAQRRLLIVDLRQESHAFLDGRAVSWCADKDWSNVGRPIAWILGDEESQLVKLAAAPDQLVYAVHKDTDGRIQVLGSSPLHVTRAETEAMMVARLPSRLSISYFRLPVTDHRAPEDDAVRTFLEKLGNVDATAWVHFHCHGGDGRTTTFLTMYDMLNVSKAWSSRSEPADLEYFRARQLRLFHYDLRPNPTTKRWQAPLSEVRWRRLEEFRRYAFEGYTAGRPWPGFAK
jgi:inositol hexakisphosphate